MTKQQDSAMVASFTVNGVPFVFRGVFNPTHCFGASKNGTPLCLKDIKSNAISFPSDDQGNIPVAPHTNYVLATLEAPAPVVIFGTAAPAHNATTPKKEASPVKEAVAPVAATTAAAAPMSASSPVGLSTLPSKKDRKKAAPVAPAAVPPVAVPAPVAEATAAPSKKSASPPSAAVAESSPVPEQSEADKKSLRALRKAMKKEAAAPAAAALSTDSEDEPLAIFLTQHNSPSSPADVQTTPVHQVKGGKRSRNPSPAAASSPPTPIQSSDSSASTRKKNRAEKKPPILPMGSLDSDAPLLALAQIAPKKKAASPPQASAPVPTMTHIPRARPASTAAAPLVTPRPSKPHPKRPADDSSDSD